MWLYILYTFGLIVLLSILEWIYSNFVKRPGSGPYGLPFLYCMLPLMNFDNLYNFLNGLHDKFGKTVVFKQSVMSPWWFVTIDEDVADHICKRNFENYVKGDLYRIAAEDIFGRGIFIVDGDEWKRHRKIASLLFKNRLLRKFVPQYLKHAANLVSHLKSKNGKEIDMQSVLSSYTLETFCDVAMGMDEDFLSEKLPFEKAMDAANRTVSIRFVFPQIVHFKNWFEHERAHVKNIALVNEKIFSYIDKRMKSQKEGETLIDFFLSAKDDKGEPLSREYLREAVIGFLFAGRETTAQSLTWLFKFVAEIPSVEKKMREEISKVMKDKEEVEGDMIEEFVYIKAAVNEALRLFGPVPLDMKTAVKDDILPNGMKVPAGSMVAWFGWGMGRCSSFYDKPLEFRPERWFGENGGLKVPNSTSTTPPFMPFQVGPRTCLGMRLALDEVIITTVKILQNFTFQSTQQSRNVEVQVGGTSTAKGGMFLIPKQI